MRIPERLVPLLALLPAFVAPATAGNTASHRVIVRVVSIAEMGPAGGEVQVSVQSGQPSAQLQDASGHVRGLRWRTNEAQKKLTAEACSLSAGGVLRLRALNVSGGTSAGEATLGTTAVEVVRNVSGMNGRCDLRYEASGVDSAEARGAPTAHAVIFTLTDAQ